MARQKVASLDADNVIALGGTRVDKKTGKTVNNPTDIEGYYLGSRKVQSNTGESTLHFFQTAKGNVGVWGKTDLDRKLGTLEKGVMAYVQFTGKKKVPRGNMYTFSVEFDPDFSIDVSGLELSTGGESDEVTEESADVEASGDYEGDNQEDSTETYEDARDDAADLEAQRAAQKARVEAVLAKGKAKPAAARTGTR